MYKKKCDLAYGPFFIRNKKCTLMIKNTGRGGSGTNFFFFFCIVSTITLSEDRFCTQKSPEGGNFDTAMYCQF